MSLLKNIPKVDKVLLLPEIQSLLASVPRPLVLKAIRSVLEKLRDHALQGKVGLSDFAEESIIAMVLKETKGQGALHLKPVINGTGVVIHTNLGRSPLSHSIRDNLSQIAFGYSNLEFDLDRGERGTRYEHVEGLLCELTGAEAALVVNNNAAAVLLALSSLAAGREVIVSRGELVEIGGSFRIPDVMAQSGAVLKEVGTTNRTHPADYQQACTEATALLMKIHASNFAVVGFTAEVSAAGMVAIGREKGIPVIADVGSGNLVDLSTKLEHAEPTIQEYLRSGVDVVTFSGDKLLGGPQAGIIVGKQSLLSPMKKHPLLRALRIDKLTLAALEGTLRLFRDERQALAEIPTLRMLTTSAQELAKRGSRLKRLLRGKLPATVKLSLVKGFSQVGGGALPLAELPTFLLAIQVDGMSAQELESKLRMGDVPVIGRIYKGDYLLDLRTIEERDFALLSTALSYLYI